MSFNTTVTQMTEMFQWPKCISKNDQIFLVKTKTSPFVWLMMWLFLVTQWEMWLLVSDWLATLAIAKHIGLLLNQGEECATRATNEACVNIWYG